MQRTEDFLQSQGALLRQDPFGKSSDDDSESEGEDDSSSFTHSMRTVSSFTHKPSVHESQLQQLSQMTNSMDLTQAREEQFQQRLDQIIEDKADHISELILQSAIANNEHLVPLAKLFATPKLDSAPNKDSHKIKN